MSERDVDAPELPVEWPDAHPVMSDFMRATHARFNEHRDEIAQQRNELEVRTVERRSGEAEMRKTIVGLESETRRLNDNYLTIVALNQQFLQQASSEVAKLQGEVHKSITMGALQLGVVLVVAIVFALWRLSS